MQEASTTLEDVSIEIIQRCYNHCLHCSTCSTEWSTTILPLPVITRLISGLHALKINKICLSGGEPLLHPDIVEIVQEIAEHRIRADIYSCGIVVQDGTPMAIPNRKLELLKRAGVSTLIFNLPSMHEETYNFITQSKGRLPLLLESIRRTIDCGIMAEIHFVPMKPNVNEVARVVEYAQKEKIQQVNFLKLIPHGRALKNADQILLSDDEIVSLQGQLLHLERDGCAVRIGLPLMEANNAPRCHAVKEKLYIRFDGCVFGCEAFKYITFRDEQNAEILPDSIWKQDIQNIYQHSAYLKCSLGLISTYKGTKYGCENCPVQKYIKNRSLCDE